MSCAAGAASSGGAISGPIKPPFQHPEWQGSVPAKWMDTGSGYQRGKPLHNSDVREGYNGVARQGLGPFAIDAPFRLHEETLRRTKQFPSMDHGIAPWCDHPRQFIWKPSRRKLEDHEFVWRVGPKTRHGGLLAHADQPDTISKRPPFVDKSAFGAPRPYDLETERCQQKVWNKQQTKKRQAAMAEDRWERSQVLQLESWERSHLRAPPAANTTVLGSRSLSDTNLSRKPKRSQSETGLHFVRHQQTY